MAESDRLLTDEELEELTGYHMPSKQVGFLRQLGLQPAVRPDGKPRITFAAVTAAMTGAVAAKQGGQPNFSALRQQR